MEIKVDTALYPVLQKACRSVVAAVTAGPVPGSEADQKFNADQRACIATGSITAICAISLAFARHSGLDPHEVAQSFGVDKKYHGMLEMMMAVTK